MRLVNSLVALSSGASLVSATTYDNVFYAGPQPRQHMFNESNLNDLYTPNSTNSVNFTIGGEEWTWRVNVTSLSVPDADLDLDRENQTLPDPRVVVTTFDFQWPNTNETLNETAIRFNEHPVGGSAQSLHGPQTSGNSSLDEPICMFEVLTPMWPNVTNKLQDNTNGDCEAVLGQECVRTLLAQTSLRKGSNGCALPDINIDACEGVFNTGNQAAIAPAISRGSYHDRANYTSYYGNSDDPELNISYLQQTRSGEGVYFTNSEASPEPNSTALRQAESQLRFIILTLPGGNSKAAVCTRVDPSIDDVEVSPISQRAGWDEDKSDSGDSGNAGDSDDGGDGDGDSSAAGPRFAAAWSSVGLAGLAVAVSGLL